MAERQTREALAIRRDNLGEYIVALLPNASAADDYAHLAACIRNYRRLADEIARRGEPVQQGRLQGVR